MNVMKPIAIDKITPKHDWIYEVKYDGFRTQIVWNKNKVQLISRNEKDLSNQFPEIIAACHKIQPRIAAFLPAKLDGELVILNHDFQANFPLIQTRGRLKAISKINEAANQRPATFIAFDLIEIKGECVKDISFVKRKDKLHVFYHAMESTNKKLQIISTYEQYEEISSLVFTTKAEGIIAKKKKSTYRYGKRHHDWYKEKNWRTIEVFLTTYDPKNDYFSVAVYENDSIVELGKCKNGLHPSTYQTLKKLFIHDGEKDGAVYVLPPAICAHVHVLDVFEGELREPEFVEVSPHIQPENCTMSNVKLSLAMLPEVGISNTDKIFWPKHQLAKGDLLIYIRDISPFMLPYLYQRALTVIRCPDGVEEGCFFQKNLPDYAPKYIDFIADKEKRIQLCNHLDALIWYANHSALEYHIPFQTIGEADPTEIVFDLDPPSQKSFHLALKAARIIKQLLDHIELKAFVKTSGNKGLQIHIPFKRNTVTYEESAVFTETIARTVVSTAPELFTIERFKKHRGNKLYIDYVQHGENRTIIAPYSPRKSENATVATPLYWEEVRSSLVPTQFTIRNVVERVHTVGCPWLGHFEKARNQKLTKLIELVRNK